MIHVDYIDRPQLDRDDADGVHALRRADVRARSVRPTPSRSGEDGIVRSALEAEVHRVLELRAGVPVRHPTVHIGPELMMKCDMCYDRHVGGARPMCATVCPSQALTFGPPDVIARQRLADRTN
jgi:ferredoxin